MGRTRPARFVDSTQSRAVARIARLLLLRRRQPIGIPLRPNTRAVPNGPVHPAVRDVCNRRPECGRRRRPSVRASHRVRQSSSFCHVTSVAVVINIADIIPTMSPEDSALASGSVVRPASASRCAHCHTHARARTHARQAARLSPTGSRRRSFDGDIAVGSVTRLSRLVLLPCTAVGDSSAKCCISELIIRSLCGRYRAVKLKETRIETR